MDPSPTPTIERYAESVVPTEYGNLRVVVFREPTEPPSSPSGACFFEHIALACGELSGQDDVLTRVHSECWTGEVIHSLKCDCHEQLDRALRAIVAHGSGVVLYLRQEGRGIGLGNKIRAYALQAQGADTVDANRMLGFGDDLRTYSVAAAMLRALGVRSVALLTNNPAKVAGLEGDGVRVTRRVPMSITANPFNTGYLQTKQTRMGHDLPDDVLHPTPRVTK